MFTLTMSISVMGYNYKTQNEGHSRLNISKIFVYICKAGPGDSSQDTLFFLSGSFP